MIGVTRIASGGSGGHLGGGPGVKSEECPSLQMRAVLDVNFSAHDLGALVVAALVDGALVHRAADLEYQHGLVGPGAGCEKRLVSAGLDEHVVEHMMAHRHGAVGHVESRT